MRQQIKDQFGTYLSPALVKKIQKDPSVLKLGGERRTMTFLFCDIRGFTPISEKYKDDPIGLTELINSFLTPMTDIIMKNNGTIDKYMGDCIMAFWNAPLEVDNHAEMAVKSALEMIEELKILNNNIPVEINIGIGINTGDCVVGNMGSEQRFDYSVLGDAVNLASRLESNSKNYDATLIVGEDTVSETKHLFDYEYVDSITVKGQTREVMIYSIGE
tara:strand:- start:356 stop:1006 length:651 start_codon:yes stop_codon:yes gene_type:complete